MAAQGAQFWSGDVGYSGLIGLTLEDLRRAFANALVDAKPDLADLQFINGSLNNFRLAQLRRRGFKPSGALERLDSARKALDRALGHLLPAAPPPDEKAPYLPSDLVIEDVSTFFAETLDPDQYNLQRLRRFADEDLDYSFYEDTKAAIRHMVFMREAVRTILGDIELDQIESAILEPDRRLLLQLSVVFQVNAGAPTVSKDRITNVKSSAAGDFVRSVFRSVASRMPKRKDDKSRFCSLVGDLMSRKRIHYHLEELRRSNAYRSRDPDIQTKISRLRADLEAILTHRKNEMKSQIPSV